MSTKSITVSDLNNALQSSNPPIIFDVRKKPAFDSDPRLLPSATWQIFDQVEQWGKGLSEESKNGSIVVYCVKGHEVSQNATQALCDMGLDAKYLEGGWVEWKDADLPLTQSDQSQSNLSQNTSHE